MSAVRTHRRTRLLVLLLCVGFLGAGCEALIDFVAGGAHLGKDSGPLPPGWNPSGRVLLGSIPASHINKVVFVRLLPVAQKDRRFRSRYDSFNWGYHYPGFPVVDVEPAEFAKLMSALRGGRLFDDDPTRNACLDKAMLPALALEPCPQAPTPLYRTYYDIRNDAIYRGRVAELQAYLPQGRIARLEMYWDHQTVAFSTGHTYEVQIHGLSDVAHALIADLHRRAVLRAFELEFPRESPQGALTRGRRVFGGSYDSAIAEIRASGSIESLLGTVDEIRPAKGLNHAGAWADSSWAEFTFRVRSGTRAGLVLIDLKRSKQFLVDERIYDF